MALAKLSVRVNQGGGGRYSLVGSTSWAESTITYASAPPIGATLVEMPTSTRDGTLAGNVTGAVNADPDGLMSFAMTWTSAGQAFYHSREDGQPPRLAMTISCSGGGPPGTPDLDGDGWTDPCDCAPNDAGVFALPREVGNLRWQGSGVLTWDSEAAYSGSGTRYDVMSGALVDLALTGPGSGDLCLADNAATTQISDTTPTPAAGKGRYFLVRADNACGKGRYETSTEGRDRQTSVCP